MYGYVYKVIAGIVHDASRRKGFKNVTSRSSQARILLYAYAARLRYMSAKACDFFLASNLKLASELTKCDRSFWLHVAN
jgi:hypothetical protein